MTIGARSSPARDCKIGSRRKRVSCRVRGEPCFCPGVTGSVQSGFGDGAGWDDDLDSLGRGWQYELRCRKHFLEYHRTRRRKLTTITRHPANDPDGTIHPLMGSREALLSKQEGDDVAWIAPGGDRPEGVMLLDASPRQWAVRLPAHDQAVIRRLSEGHGASGVSWSYVSTWGMTDEQRSPLLNLLQRWVDDSLS